MEKDGKVHKNWADLFSTQSLYLPKIAKINLTKVRHFLKEHIIDLHPTDEAPKWIGSGAKKILVLFQSEQAETTIPELLVSILGALKLQPEQDVHSFALVEPNHFSFAQIQAENKYRFVLVFGCTPEQLSLKISVPKNSWISFLGAQMLFSDALSDLAAQKERKLALWDAVKGSAF
jgi:DNA polymerase III psi subunit